MTSRNFSKDSSTKTTLDRPATLQSEFLVAWTRHHVFLASGGLLRAGPLETNNSLICLPRHWLALKGPPLGSVRDQHRPPIPYVQLLKRSPQEQQEEGRGGSIRQAVWPFSPQVILGPLETLPLGIGVRFTGVTHQNYVRMGREGQRIEPCS